MAERRTIRTDYLARVEGEGAMTVRLEDGARRARRAADLRAAALLRGAAARPLVPRGARHHRAHLRHLPGRLPDERRQRDREPLRRRGARADPACCAGSSTAASGSRATRCTSTCSTRPTSSATRARSSSRATRRRRSSAGSRSRRPATTLMTLVGGREIHPINVRVGGFYRAPTRRELRALVEPLERAREAALETVRWTAGLRLPRAHGRVRARRALAPRRVRDRARPDRLRRAASTSRPPSTTSTSRSCTSSARTRSTRGCASAAPTSAARSPATRSNHDAALAARARGGRARRASGAECRDPFRSIVVRSVELVYACDEALRLIDAYEEPDAPAVAGRAGRGHRLRRQRGAARAALPPLPPRRRRARSSTRRSSRRPRRTSSRSRTTCATSSARNAAPRRRRRSARSASRRSATTTRASRAPPTSSTLEVERR